MNYNSAPPFSGAWHLGVDQADFVWEKWFAWFPVRVNGKRVWFKTIYSKLIWTREDVQIFLDYEYGTIFDVLKSSQ